MSGDITQTQAANNAVLAGSPRSSHGFVLPSPIITKRTRTLSVSERAKTTPVHKGKVVEFCRQRGHGFIQPTGAEEGSENIFVHISDIEGEYVPLPGDDVSYNKIQVPPKNEKWQAVHVTITHLKPGTHHETWTAPSSQMSPH